MPERRDTHQQVPQHLPSVAALCAGPWLVSDPARMEARIREIAARAEGMGLEEIEARLRGAAGVQDDEPRGYTVNAEGVAVLRLHGEMVPDADFWMRLFGMAGTNDLRAGLAAALEDASVRSVLFRVNSDGGLPGGVQELHREIAAATKPVHVHNEGVMASAALWAMCGADRITAADTALTGSIGTFLRMVDRSEAYKAEGLRVEVLRSSPAKGAPTPGEPVTAANTEWRQQYVDDVAAMFFGDVRAARGLTDEAWAALGDPGQAWVSSRAVAAGLIDATETLDAAMVAAQNAAGGPEPIAPLFAPQAREVSSDMDTKQLEARLAELEAQVQTQNEDLAAAKAEAVEATAKAKALQAAADEAAAQAETKAKADLVEAARADGRLVGDMEAKMDLEATAAALPLERFKALLEGLPVQVQGKLQGKPVDEPPTDNADQLSAEDEAELERIKGKLGTAAPMAAANVFSFTQIAHQRGGDDTKPAA